MKSARELVDVYAETQVLNPPQKAAPAPKSDGDSDALALYEEYAREVAGDAAVPPKKSPARGKR